MVDVPHRAPPPAPRSTKEALQEKGDRSNSPPSAIANVGHGSKVDADVPASNDRNCCLAVAQSDGEKGHNRQ